MTPKGVLVPEDERLEESAKVFRDTLRAEAPTEDQPETQEQPPSDEGQGDPEATEARDTAVNEQPDPFSDNFDPASLPPELKPAYDQLRADYTRKRQAEAPMRRFFEDRGIDPADPEAAFSALAEELGYQIDDDDDQPQDEGFDDPDQPDEFGPDPVETLAQRLDRIEQERADQLQREADLASLSEDLNTIRQRMGREPSKDEIEYFGQYATRNRDGRLGIIDVYDRTEALMSKRQQEWARSKDAPVVQSGGSRGVDHVDLDDEEQRRAYTAEILKQGMTPD
jgi:hypothetical protein